MGRQRDAAQIAKDRRRIGDLYLKGWLQVDIAKEIGVNQSTVSRDLKTLHKQWLADAAISYDKAKGRELAKIDRLEREYWDAWERSKEDAEIEIREQAGATKDDARARLRREKRGRTGDPSFLRGVQWCIEQRCKIFGVEAPKELKHSGAVVSNFTDNLDDDE